MEGARELANRYSNPAYLRTWGPSLLHPALSYLPTPPQPTSHHFLTTYFTRAGAVLVLVDGVRVVRPLTCIIVTCSVLVQSPVGHSTSPGAAASFESATGDGATHFDTHVSFQHHMDMHYPTTYRLTSYTTTNTTTLTIYYYY